MDLALEYHRLHPNVVINLAAVALAALGGGVTGTCVLEGVFGRLTGWAIA